MNDNLAKFLKENPDMIAVKIICRCGRTSEGSLRYPLACTSVKVSWCRHCGKDCAGVPIQIYYRADGTRIY